MNPPPRRHPYTTHVCGWRLSCPLTRVELTCRVLLVIAVAAAGAWIGHTLDASTAWPAAAALFLSAVAVAVLLAKVPRLPCAEELRRRRVVESRGEWAQRWDYTTGRPRSRTVWVGQDPPPRGTPRDTTWVYQTSGVPSRDG